MQDKYLRRRRKANRDDGPRRERRKQEERQNSAFVPLTRPPLDGRGIEGGRGRRRPDSRNKRKRRGSDGAATGLPPLRQTISPPTTTTDERISGRGRTNGGTKSKHLHLIISLFSVCHWSQPSVLLLPSPPSPPSIIGTDSNR